MSGQQEENERLDARVRAELAAALPEPPLDEVDWEALRQAIAQRAELRLARLRAGGRARTWWEYEAGWAARALPAAIAAAAALVLLLGRLQRTATPAPVTVAATAASTSTAAPVTLEAAIGTGTTESAVLYASADQDALLRAAVASQ